jgi:hypothetical protein
MDCSTTRSRTDRVAAIRNAIELMDVQLDVIAGDARFTTMELEGKAEEYGCLSEYRALEAAAMAILAWGGDEDARRA